MSGVRRFYDTWTTLFALALCHKIVLIAPNATVHELSTRPADFVEVITRELRTALTAILRLCAWVAGCKNVTICPRTQFK